MAKANKMLITCDNWFYGADGKQYNAAWGDVEILTDKEAFGITTNRNSTNWYAKVGKSGKAVIIAGCQIHYAVECAERPNTNGTTWNRDILNERKDAVLEFSTPQYIYIPDEN